MRFSQDFIEKVRESTNIVDVIGQHTQLRRSGTHRLVGLCPFHNEKTGSFSVSEDKQMYYCFGCKKAGNVYTFIQEIQGLSFPESVEFLAERAGIPVPKEAIVSPGQRQEVDARKEREKLLYRINQFASAVFEAQLKGEPPSTEVQDYLLTRGLKAETIDQFQIGFARDDWQSLTNAFTKKSVPLDAVESLGLIRKKNDDRTRYYDNFRNRLMFPIVLPTGQVVGFGGRALGDGQPKYLNSPESEVFHKGKVLYGLNESAKFVRLEDRVVVVEGYMDFLALFQAGLKPVVATLGTALTPDHARLLKRHTKNIIILFDGDEAGQVAAERSLPLLLAEGLIPRGLVLPDQLDPDEFVQKNGLDALEEKLRSAPELFMMIVEKHMRGYRGTSAEKVTLMDHLSPHLKACSDSRLKDLYMRELAERLDVESAWVQKAVASGQSLEPNRFVGVSKPQEGPPGGAPAAPKKEPGEVPTRIRVAKPPRSELYLLNVMLMKEKYFQAVMSSETAEQISHEGIKQVLARAQQLYGQMPNKFDSLSALLVAEVEPAEMVSLYLQPPLADLTEEGADKLVTDCSRKIREAYLRRQSKQLRANLHGHNAQEQIEKLEQIMNIHRSRHSLNKDS